MSKTLLLDRPSIQDILKAKSQIPPIILGYSRGQRPLRGYRLGHGHTRVSLIAGCHADEPTGPIFLEHLVQFLGSLAPNSPLLTEIQWWIVPQVNPDGEHINKAWYHPSDQYFDLARNLLFTVRELPGDDIEFGFAMGKKIKSLRPENEAVYKFWKSAGTKFDLHVSLHGMRISYGPWFLIDRDFGTEVSGIMAACRDQVSRMGYVLHDVDRKGEKGFYRLDKGFGSRPDSVAMRNYFKALGQEKMADNFHASSMESIRSLGDPCLTLVTEMPLFIVPRVSNHLTWPDPILQNWSDKFNKWRLALSNNTMSQEQVNREAGDQGLICMPLIHQMQLQWTFIWSGVLQRIRSKQDTE